MSEQLPKDNAGAQDPTLRVLASEFALGVNSNHVFGDEPVGDQQKRRVTSEGMNRIVAEWDQDGKLTTYFVEQDGTKHP